MLTILIMAGGIGERFWPLSSPEKPKQTLDIFTGKSMIRETVDRVLNLVPINQIFIATNLLQKEIIKYNIPELPDGNLILEPLFKDTAAAIGYGSVFISEKFPDAIVCVLASDHIIKNVPEFIKSINLAHEVALNGDIVTFGVKPTKPETGYGYIESESMILGIPSKAISFREKPNYETAIDYLQKGNYFWNSGIFIFSVSTILENFEKHAHIHYELLLGIKHKTVSLIEAFQQFPRLSIDYAIMEKSDDVVVIPVDFGWNDVGSFNALEELFDKNENDSVSQNTNMIELDSYRNIVISQNKTVSLIGIEDTIVIETDHAILITKKNESQRIKEILKMMENGKK